MKYDNLQELLSHSSSTRQYFLSLPVSLQLALHRHDRIIHTAADLHFYANTLQKTGTAINYDYPG